MKTNHDTWRRIEWDDAEGAWRLDQRDVDGLTMSQVADLDAKSLLDLGWYLDDQYDRDILSLAALEAWRDALSGYIDSHTELMEGWSSLFAEHHAKRRR